MQKQSGVYGGKNTGNILLLGGLGAMICIVLAVVVGVRVYVHSNWSAEYRMNTQLDVWNENIETAMAHVNTRQALLMSAAYTCGIDARALGASIVARRLVDVQPVRQEWNEMLGTAVNLGVAQISVQSTEAALRVVFAPNMEDSLLYYPRSEEGAYSDAYTQVRTALSAYRTATSEQIRHVLKNDEWFTIHAAGLIAKQAMVRCAKEQEFAEREGMLNHVAETAPLLAPQLAFLAQDREDVAHIATLLYKRGDMMP
jgi:hypothetical protein